MMGRLTEEHADPVARSHRATLFGVSGVSSAPRARLLPDGWGKVTGTSGAGGTGVDTKGGGTGAMDAIDNR